MRNDKLSVKSMDFAVSIIYLVKRLKENKEQIISKQIGRSASGGWRSECDKGENKEYQMNKG